MLSGVDRGLLSKLSGLVAALELPATVPLILRAFPRETVDWPLNRLLVVKEVRVLSLYGVALQGPEGRGRLGLLPVS